MKDGKNENQANDSQRGTAIVIVLLIMALLTGFVALALSRTTSETLATANDAAESRAFAAAEASLENMTRDLDKVFEDKLTPSDDDINQVESATVSGFSNYTFDQHVDKTGFSQIVVSNRLLKGMNALRQGWQITTTATDAATGVKVKLRRQFFNDEVPIFQFGIFYDDDLEFHPGPRFDFGGRVHSNRNIYMMAQTGLYFSSRVSSVKDVITDIARNGSDWSEWGENVWVKNSSGVYQQVRHNMGSALHNPANGANLSAYNSDMPTIYKDASWTTYQTSYGGNLLSNQLRLDLPLALDSRQRGNQVDYVELIKRGKNIGDLYNDKTGTVWNPNVKPVVAAAVDSPVTTKERFANKSGIRISLADTKNRLPGCANVGGQCGRQLDDTSGGRNGYQPVAMTDGYQATPINAARFQKPNYTNGVARQSWIKVELVQVDDSTGLPATTDVTDDFLSLGVTEPAPVIKEPGTGRVDFQITDDNFKMPRTSSGTLQMPADSKYPDNRSVIKLQRFMMPGIRVVAASPFLTSGADSNWNWTIRDNNFVLVNTDGSNGVNKIDKIPDDGGSPTNNKDTGYNATVFDGATSQTKARVAPFPIMMFDTREGLYNDNLNTPTVYGTKVPVSGVMSMVDIDVANLRKFFRGDYDKLLPTTTDYAGKNGGVSLKSTAVPNKNGWVLYVSDRRGDYDFDGEYDMEDVYINSANGTNDGTMQVGEDVNNDGVLQADYNSGNEAAKYNVAMPPDAAAVINTKYYRRGVRLINGTVLPGNYDAANPDNTNGFTLASENGVYVFGNYNATGVRTVGTPTQSTDYLPQDTVNHIPASIVGDAITVLSNSWKDANSFNSPFNFNNRMASETTDRFAMLAGDTMSSMNGTPNQGGSDPHLSGGVHNFKRFLENWTNIRLNYDGSLINLYNSHNNNGAFKCCYSVYSPPTRNWVFDATFLDPTRLPPGTPFFQSLSLTGFQRVNQ